MRRLSLMFFLLSCLTALAQDNYKRLLTPGKVWKCQVVGDYVSAVVTTPYTITVEGDTVVDGRNCKRLSVVYDDSQKPMYDLDIVAYEEDKKVYVHKYMLADNDDEWTLMLNFSLHKGDAAPIYGGCLLDEDSVEVDGNSYRRLTSYNLCWVEGMGAASDVWATNISRPTSMETKEMLACYENGKLLFSKDDFAKEAYKRDEAGLGSLPAQKSADGAAYDLGGRCTKTTRKGEIYIQDGVKRMAR